MSDIYYILMKRDHITTIYTDFNIVKMVASTVEMAAAIFIFHSP